MDKPTATIAPRTWTLRCSCGVVLTTAIRSLRVGTRDTVQCRCGATYQIPDPPAWSIAATHCAHE